ncbi:MAG: HAD family hydrolase [Acidimicrobiales bacterium]
MGGNALDLALWAAPAAQAMAGVGGAYSGYKRLGFLPFDHDRQLSSVVVRTAQGDTLMVTKGAPEAVTRRCIDLPAQTDRTLTQLFGEGARVVAVATRDAHGLGEPTAADERDLRLVGFLTFIDRPKPDAGAAIAKLSRIGISVKIITGDNGIVANKVCDEIGIAVEAVLTGIELDTLDDDALASAIPHTTVFARVSPEQKSRIIKIARRTGIDVAYMGDGVNDAVALHAADVGISSTPRPTSQKTPPISCCSTRTSAFSLTGSWKAGASSRTLSSMSSWPRHPTSGTCSAPRARRSSSPSCRCSHRRSAQQPAVRLRPTRYPHRSCR